MKTPGLDKQSHLKQEIFSINHNGFYLNCIITGFNNFSKKVHKQQYLGEIKSKIFLVQVFLRGAELAVLRRFRELPGNKAQGSKHKACVVLFFHTPYRLLKAAHIAQSNPTLREYFTNTSVSSNSGRSGVSCGRAFTQPGIVIAADILALGK